MSRLSPQTNMEWVRSGDDIFVRLDIGEEIHASLQALAEEANIDAAAITSGIGRTREHVYGFMDESKKYRRFDFPAASELVSLQGNLARLEDGTPFTHIHATFSADDYKVHGGHLFTATVHIVAEIHLRVMSQAIMTRCPLADSDFVALRFS